MTRDLIKTLLFVVVAAGFAGATALTIPDRSKRDAEFLELGSKFFPNFVDPNAATTLEVIDYDAETARTTPFKVELKSGAWSIPSHFGYPADGKDRLTKTATGVMDLTKDTLRSQRIEDHEEFGVVDPLDTKATSPKGRGKRVTLKDASEKVLADFIIGKEVKDGRGLRYVRVPDDKKTYGVKVNVDLSTRFADWIETNLLKVETSKIRKIDFSSHKIDPNEMTVVPGEVLTIDRKDGNSPWNAVNVAVPTGKELDTEKLLALVQTLGDVKISGVRQKPEGLTRDLKATGDIKNMTNTIARSLISRGFYPLRDGRILSNEGDIVVACEDGAKYTLRFGEVYFGSGDALTAGVEEPAAKGADKDKDKDKDKKKDDASASRYLMVTVAFDPALLPPVIDPEANKLPELPTDVFHHDPGTPERIAQDKAKQEKADKKKADEDKRIADAEKHVKELSDRFAGWYYLTTNTAFRSLALNRENLFKDKSTAPPGGGGPEGFPGLPGGFPGGGRGGPGGLPFNPHQMPQR